jgi:ABC-2 type transport system ATP-binding protein
MSQRFSLYPDLGALENLDFFGGAYGISRRDRRARARTLLADVELDPDDRRPCGAMPGGTRQRVALACALIHAPRIVFLDEPTAGVDPAARRNFWRIIRGIADAGTTVFVTTHYMDEAEYCARVGLMADGVLVALDTPAALKRTWVPGRLLEVRGEALDVAAIERTAGVGHAAPFGAGLHVRGPADLLDPAAVRDALATAGARGVQIEEIEPTLEDVFLEVVRRGAA